MSDCWLCGDFDLTKSYFLRIFPICEQKTFIGGMVEVCPECHHTFKYGTEDQIKDYILRKEINMRGFKIGK